MTPDDPILARFGRPEVVFRAYRGQTTAGILFGLALFGFGGVTAAFGDGWGLWNRVVLGLFAAGGVVIALWFDLLRNWRLVVSADKLVLTGDWGTAELAWAAVTEVIEWRLGIPDGRIGRMELCAGPRTMTVNPINLRERDRLFDTLRRVAEHRGIPVRVEVDPLD